MGVLNDLNRAVDIVFCLDATGANGGMLDWFRRNAVTLGDRLKEAFADNGREVESLRVRIVAFRDFGYPDMPPIEESRFFTLPEEGDMLAAFLDSIECRGGGDIPENALEAIAIAMKSDFISPNDCRRCRQMIVLLTDAPALELGARRECTGYPEGMPRDVEELTEWWENGMGDDYPYVPRCARMLIVAPDDPSWESLHELSRIWAMPTDGSYNSIDFDDMFYMIADIYSA